MTLYKKWHNFILHVDPERVSTEVQRLDTSKSIRFKTRTTAEMLLYSDEEVAQRGVVKREADFVEPGDKFEAMDINPKGHVTIWTTKHVYEILRDGQTERMRRFPRYPPDHIFGPNMKSLIGRVISIVKALKTS